MVVRVTAYDPNNPGDATAGALMEMMKEDRSILIEPGWGIVLPNGARAGLLMSIAGRTAPDIADTWFHTLNNDVRQGFYYPLNEWIGEDRNGDGQIDEREARWAGWKDIPQLWRQVATVRGKIYGIPKPGFAYMAPIFRTDMAREAGLDSNHPPRTWDEFY